jgi:hypothetical protein
MKTAGEVSSGYAAGASAISRANGERLVLALGTPISHSPTRKKLKDMALKR